MHKEKECSRLMFLLTIIAAALIFAVFGRSVEAAGLLKAKNGG